MSAIYTNPLIESSWREYEALTNGAWVKQWFFDETGGFVVAHRLKAADDMRRSGIVAEVEGCLSLAEMGKRVLRLPENIPYLIDEVVIDGMPYRELLKFKVGETKPRGYPDVYFDGMTWDFKETETENIDTIRQLIKDGRKANNVIFVGAGDEEIKAIGIAMEREFGRKLKDGSWMELPNLYCLKQLSLFSFWKKQK
jgi:hypothetical protein